MANSPRPPEKGVSYHSPVPDRRHVVYLEPYPHLQGGGQATTKTLAAGMLEHGWTTEVVAPAGGPAVDDLRDCGVAVTVVPAPAGLLRYGGHFGTADLAHAATALPRWWAGLARHLRRRRAALFDVSDERGVVLGAAAARIGRVPLVWHIHSAGSSRAIGRVGATVARRCVVPSSGLAATLGGSRTVVIPPSLPEVPTPPTAPRDEPARIVTAGRIEPVKGLDILIDAVAKLAPRFPGLHLDIYGAPQQGHEGHRAALDEQCRRLGVDQSVSFVGHVRRPWERWGGATMYVQASRAETFGLSLVEAMACGLPVVATRTWGPSDIVTHGRTGLLVPPGDPSALGGAIERIVSDPSLAGRLAAEGRRHALATYTRDRLLASTTRVYEQVVG